MSREARLTGPRPALDPRIHIARGDLVEIALAAQVAAGRYTAPMPMLGAAPHTPMRGDPDPKAPATSELLLGEAFDVYDIQADWAFGRTVHDGYTGWLPLTALDEPAEEPAPVHVITARAAPVFTRPDIKAPVETHLPHGARIHGVPAGKFIALASGGHVHTRHVAALATPSPLGVARLFEHAPYVWGGRTPAGVDCSGLVQAALAACGFPCPRDSDLQREALGTPVALADARADDLAFFPGHVGILSSKATLFHANAHWMCTMDEPLEAVRARVDLLCVKRL